MQRKTLKGKIDRTGKKESRKGIQGCFVNKRGKTNQMGAHRGGGRGYDYYGRKKELEIRIPKKGRGGGGRRPRRRLILQGEGGGEYAKKECANKTRKCYEIRAYIKGERD